MTVVVTGLIAQYPFGGIPWDYLHYLIGFQTLGHNVYYLEDSGTWPYNPKLKTTSDDISFNIDFLSQIMKEFGFEERWVYRSPVDQQIYGNESALSVIRKADLLVNVSSFPMMQMDNVSTRIFIDTDPMFNQISIATNKSFSKKINEHHHHFTFGLNIGNPDCLAPTANIQWKKTLPPVSLKHWPFQKEKPHPLFTTVMNWASYEPKQWEDKTYGQKDVEFEKFIDLPSLTSQKFCIAMGQGVGGKRPTEMLTQKGWSIVEPDQVLPNHRTYQEFLQRSKAEWSIAKHGYVAGKTGWFSGRTACYLALGRPAVIQDTGWTKTLPQGKGIMAFTDIPECMAAIEDVNTFYPSHSKDARDFAETHLEASKVCQDILSKLS